MQHRPPAFQLYIDDWRGSRSVQRMTFGQRGMYMEMLIEQWDKGCLPDCPRACAHLLGGTEDEWLEHWPTLRRKFVVRRKKTGTQFDSDIPTDHDASRRIINLRLERYKRSLRSYKRGKAEAGKKGGHGKAQKLRLLEAGKNVANASTNVANPGSVTLTVSSTPTLKKKTLGVEDPKFTKIAEDLMEFYPEVFAHCRSGSVYRTTQVTYDRDWPNYYGLAETYPDARRLRAMLEVFLTRDMGDKSRPGTPGQFRHMAPECDEVLRRSGWKATA